MQALQALSAQLPVANARVAQGQKAARDMQLQQAVAAAPQGAPIGQTAAQLGTASAQMAGQQAVQQAQQNVQQQGQLGQLALGAQQQQLGADVFQAKGAAQQQEFEGAQRLARVSEEAKKSLYDAQMQFERDEQGRTLFNESQLDDYKRLNARSAEDLANYAQKAEQLSRKKIQMMEQAYKVINEDLNQKERLAEQSGDQMAKQQIAEKKAMVSAQMAREKARKANNDAKNQAMMTGVSVAGGIAGAMLGGPAGAAAGMAAGNAAGSVATSQQQAEG